MTIETRIPGKLFLAGEYAVVEPGHAAIIAAVDSYLTVRMIPSHIGRIHSSLHPGVYLHFERQNGKIVPDNEELYPLVIGALQVTETYLHDKIPSLNDDGLYTIDIQSHLDHHDSGKKYGLGSSGAVTVAIVKAVLLYYGQTPERMLLYKLSAIVQSLLGMKGSFGDLAASSFGGLIAYSSLDRTWLNQLLTQKTILEVVSLQWKSLSIASLHLPKEVSLLVGWTGNAASTEGQITKLEGKKSLSKKDYLNFLDKSDSCVNQFVLGCENEDVSMILAAIRKNRNVLLDFSRAMNFVWETPQLTQLCECAEAYGAAAKSSGAGGGDCGICLIDSLEQQSFIEEDWKQVGILPLSLTIINENVGK